MRRRPIHYIIAPTIIIEGRALKRGDTAGWLLPARRRQNFTALFGHIVIAGGEDAA